MAQEQLAELRERIPEHVKENELLLLQLHQVQEELEAYFLQGQTQGEELTAVKQRLTETEQARDRATQQLKEQQGRYQALERDLAKAREEVAGVQKQLGSEGQRLAESEQARDRATQQLKEQQGRYQSLERDLAKAREEVAATRQTVQTDAAAATRINDLTRELAAVRSAQSTAEAALAEQRSKLSEQVQENELLLLQLHQVQEELEHYFLLNQELGSQGANASAQQSQWCGPLGRPQAGGTPP